jgi:hypothetical protein
LLILVIILVALVGIVMTLRKRRADLHKKMLAVYNSDIGRRYLGLAAGMGRTVDAPVSMERRVDKLMPLMEMRDEIYGEIRAAGVDPEEFGRFVCTKLATGDAAERS